MRKTLLLILCALGFTIAAQAQKTGVWVEPNYQKEDKENGVKADVFYGCTDGENQSFIISFRNGMMLVLNEGTFKLTPNNLFRNIYTDKYADLLIADIRIELYEDGILTDESQEKVMASEKDGKNVVMLANSKHNKTCKYIANKVFMHLKDKGSVRFIIKKEDGSNFDLIVPSNPKIEWRKHELIIEEQSFIPQ